MLILIFQFNYMMILLFLYYLEVSTLLIENILMSVLRSLYTFFIFCKLILKLFNYILKTRDLLSHLTYSFFIFSFLIISCIWIFSTGITLHFLQTLNFCCEYNYFLFIILRALLDQNIKSFNFNCHICDSFFIMILSFL